MAFQLAYEESAVLSTALLIAIREWQARLDNPLLENVHAETRVQMRIAQSMKDRVDGKPPVPASESGLDALSLRLGKLLDL